MWILAIVFFIIFFGYLVKKKKLIISLRMTIEKIVVAAGLMMVLNIIINNFGLQVAINEYTVSLVSLLGVPGLVVVTLLQNVTFI